MFKLLKKQPTFYSTIEVLFEININHQDLDVQLKWSGTSKIYIYLFFSQ